MRKNRRIVFFISCLFAGMLANYTFAQGQGVAPSAAPAQKTPGMPARIGVVDLVEVLKAHPKYNNDIKQLQAEAQQASTEFMTMQKQIQEDAKVLETFKIGSKEYIETNDAISQKAAGIEMRFNKTKRDFLLADLKLKYESYQSIKDEIQNIAGQKGYVTIVDYRTVEPNTEDPSASELEMSQLVVWHHPNVDITNEVINAINRRFGNQYPVVVTIDAEGKRITNPQNAAALAQPRQAPQVQPQRQPAQQMARPGSGPAPR